ncbi:tetratricopeptide repeat protein [Pararhodobacter sp.]|uniref:tetratricopeptide repeat protein n=1 Tax=Pararhodobacter sp. TaxID=2127056 RepID=UPI002FE33DD6
MMRFACLVLAALHLAPAAGAQGVTDCDRLAGYLPVPRAPDLPADLRGVAEIAEPAQAVAACEAARRSDPDPFLAFLLARALEAADPQDPRLPALVAEGAVASAPFAASRLGLLYQRGHGGLQRDDARARALFEESCAAFPDPRSLAGCNNLAAAMVLAEELPAAVTLFEQACDAGLGRACANLADRIEEGRAPGYDPLRMQPLRERACDLFEPHACIQAGYALTQTDPPETLGALRRFEIACDLGLADGCYRAGAVMRDATDMEFGWRARQEAFGRGCDGGVAESCYEVAVGLVYGEDGTGSLADPGEQAQGVAMFDQLCTDRDPWACTDLGYLYSEGLAVTRDPARAVALSARACALGLAVGCNNLAVHLATGDGLPQNLPQAARYYEQGCAGGSGLACLNLGDMLAAGDLGTPDPARAQAAFRKGCDLGEAEACTR